MARLNLNIYDTFNFTSFIVNKQKSKLSYNPMSKPKDGPNRGVNYNYELFKFI